MFIWDSWRFLLRSCGVGWGGIQSDFHIKPNYNWSSVGALTKIVKILCKNRILLLTWLIMQTLQPRGQVGGAVNTGRIQMVQTWSKYFKYQSFYCHNPNWLPWRPGNNSCLSDSLNQSFLWKRGIFYHCHQNQGWFTKNNNITIHVLLLIHKHFMRKWGSNHPWNPSKQSRNDLESVGTLQNNFNLLQNCVNFAK